MASSQGNSHHTSPTISYVYHHCTINISGTVTSTMVALSTHINLLINKIVSVSTVGYIKWNTHHLKFTGTIWFQVLCTLFTVFHQLCGHIIVFRGTSVTKLHTLYTQVRQSYKQNCTSVGSQYTLYAPESTMMKFGSLYICNNKLHSLHNYAQHYAD